MFWVRAFGEDVYLIHFPAFVSSVRKLPFPWHCFRVWVFSKVLFHCDTFTWGFHFQSVNSRQYLKHLDQECFLSRKYFEWCPQYVILHVLNWILKLSSLPLCVLSYSLNLKSLNFLCFWFWKIILYFFLKFVILV